MENISGNMEETITDAGSAPSKSKIAIEKGWTILMIGANGETKRLRGFKRLVFSGLFVCLLSISASLCVLYMYLNLLNENKKLRETISISNSLYGNAKTKKKRPPIANKSPFIVETNLFKNASIFINFKDPYKFDKQPVLTISKNLSYMPPLKKTRKAIPSYNRLNGMKVEDFNLILKPEKNEVGMSFVLRNKKNAKKAMAGKTFVVLSNDFDESSWVSYPEVKLRKGRPAIYKKGKAFYVARFKTIRHRAVHIDNMELFNKATVFVYSSKGRLLVDKTFPIEMML